MTKEQLDKLKELAERAKEAWLLDLWRSCNHSEIAKRMDCNSFAAAVSPDVLIRLIDELVSLRSQLEEK